MTPNERRRTAELLRAVDKRLTRMLWLSAATAGMVLMLLVSF